MRKIDKHLPNMHALTEPTAIYFSSSDHNDDDLIGFSTDESDFATIYKRIRPLSSSDSNYMLYFTFVFYKLSFFCF